MSGLQMKYFVLKPTGKIYMQELHAWPCWNMQELLNQKIQNWRKS